MSRLLLPFILLVSACSVTVGPPAGHDVVPSPVAFWFDADPRDRARMANIAEELEPHFPDMSWRIGDYEPRPDDGIHIQVRERIVPDPRRPECESCTSTVTVFTIYQGGVRIGAEEFENCSIYRPGADCFAVRRLVERIRSAAQSAG